MKGSIDPLEPVEPFDYQDNHSIAPESISTTSKNSGSSIVSTLGAQLAGISRKAMPELASLVTPQSIDIGEANIDLPIKVCVLRSVSTFTIPVNVGEHRVTAVVDSAAEVTIISDRLFTKLRKPPTKLREVKLDTGGRQLSMVGFVAGPIKLKIGTTHYSGPVYVAPIEQEMLFGVDLLTRGSAVLNIGKGTLTYNGYEITMGMGDSDGRPQVARVTVSNRRIVPPNSVVQLK